MIKWRFFKGACAISNSPTSAERIRFRNLLELANSSQYEGERANALEAARRIALRHGMTLEEAARTGLEPRPAPAEPDLARDRRGPGIWERRSDPRAAYFAYTQQQAAEREKRRWEEAVNQARARGLDEAEMKARARAEARAEQRPRRWSQARRDPHKHAAVLLEETRLPFSEIASITGLDVYSVVGMKLKMRAGAVT